MAFKLRVGLSRLMSNWIMHYLPLYNGVKMIPYNHFDNHVYQVSHPDFIMAQGLNISELEILNAMIAIKLWPPLLRGHVVRLLCNNSAAVLILQMGRNNAFMLSRACELWSYMATYNFEIRVEHINTSHAPKIHWLINSVTTTVKPLWSAIYASPLQYSQQDLCI